MNIAVALLLLLAQEPDLDNLLKDLDHEEIARRDRATEALRRLKPESVEIDKKLEALVKDGGGEVAKRADLVRRYRILARLLTDPDRILERLASPDANVRLAALGVLSKHGGAMAPIARGLLQDPQPGIQQTALNIVVAADNPEYLPDVRPLADHPNLYPTALPWLAARGDATAGPPLRAHVTRGNYWALEHLARLRQVEDIPLFRSTMSDQPNSASQVLRVIRGWDEAKRQLAREIRLLALEGVTEAVLLAADSKDAELAKALRALLTRENSAAAFALGSMGDRDAIPYLMRLVRLRRLHTAIGLLGRLRAREAVWLFQRMLAETPAVEPRDRAAYARALGDIGGEPAEDLLLILVEDAKEEVRFEAATSLGRLKCARALPALVRALDDAVAFQRPVPLPADAPVLDQFDGRCPVEWRQGREAAAGALAAITGEERDADGWRAWQERRK